MMKIPRRNFLHLGAGIAALPAVSLAEAQTYPTRPITMIVPYPPGGPVDAAARVFAERLRTSLEATIIIENASGADGSIGTRRVARSPADGYTIDFGAATTHVLNGALFSLQYDILNDFAPIAPLGSSAYILFGRKSLPADDLNELISWLKGNPDKPSAGNPGSTAVKLVMAFFQKQTATKFTIVPYRGAAPAMQDLVAGQIDLVFANPPFLPLVRDGKVKAYAVTSAARLAVAPNIPTLAEMRLPALSPSPWYGLFVPKGTPKAIIDRINAATVQALADPAVRSRLADLGVEIFPREHTGCAQRARESRCGKLVADNQGTGDQGGMTFRENKNCDALSVSDCPHDKTGGASRQKDQADEFHVSVLFNRARACAARGGCTSEGL